MDCQIIILAAGNGNRMKSELPKVMHQVGGTPMLERVIASAREVTNELILVYSLKLEQYISPYKEICKLVLQPKPLGTAHAVYMVLEVIDDNKTVAVLYGDNPLIPARVINDLLNHLISTNSSIATLCFKCDEPAEYGRIVLDELGNFLNIVEFKDTTLEERNIKICNSGVMVFKAGILKKYLPLIFQQQFDKSQELYLTSIVKVAKEKGEKVSYLLSSDHNLVVGVNTREELEKVNRAIVNII